MADKFITIRIDEKIHKRYKMVCDEFGLKMGKEIEILIKTFVEAQEDNIKLMKNSRIDK